MNYLKGGTMDDFKGKAVMVTGGAQGIGKAIAGLLVSSGAKVMIADIDAEAGEETVEEFTSSGEARYIQTDLSLIHI